MVRALGARGLGLRLRGGQRGRGFATAGEHVFGNVLGPHGAALLAFDHRGVDRGPRQHAVERLAAERQRAGDRVVVDGEIGDRGRQRVAEAEHEARIGAEPRRHGDLGAARVDVDEHRAAREQGLERAAFIGCRRVVLVA